MPPKSTPFSSGGVIPTFEDPKPGIPQMSEQQWDRIYRKIDRIKQPTRRWENLGWAMVGLFVASVIAVFGWLGRPPTARAETLLEGAAYLGLCILAVAMVIVSWTAQRGQTNQLERDKNDALEEMCDFHLPMSAKPKAASENGK